ncbi:MAG: putative lipoprotein [Bacteroidetes bacterium]|nr:putative lipoprotein [Bacteroidota bacterium]
MNFKSKILRFLLQTFSLSAVLFVFQACYGTPQDFEQDLQIEGTVVDRSNGLPIFGIKVQLGGTLQYTYTDSLGRFYMYQYNNHSDIVLQFSDVDSLENGHFLPLDTSIQYSSPYMNIPVALDPK